MIKTLTTCVLIIEEFSRQLHELQSNEVIDLRKRRQRYYKFLNCANFWRIIFKKNFQSFPKQNRKSLKMSNLRNLSTQKVV